MTGRTEILTAVLAEPDGPAIAPWPPPDGVAPLWASRDDDGDEAPADDEEEDDEDDDEEDDFDDLDDDEDDEFDDDEFDDDLDDDDLDDEDDEFDDEEFGTTTTWMTTRTTTRRKRRNSGTTRTDRAAFDLRFASGRLPPYSGAAGRIDFSPRRPPTPHDASSFPAAPADADRGRRPPVGSAVPGPA